MNLIPARRRTNTRRITSRGQGALTIASLTIFRNSCTPPPFDTQPKRTNRTISVNRVFGVLGVASRGGGRRRCSYLDQGSSIVYGPEFPCILRRNSACFYRQESGCGKIVQKTAHHFCFAPKSCRATRLMWPKQCADDGPVLIWQPPRKKPEMIYCRDGQRSTSR